VKAVGHNQINIVLLHNFKAICFGLSTKKQFVVTLTVHRDELL